MNETEEFWIPRTLDDPNLFFIWEMDSAMIFLSCAFIGIVISSITLGIVAGFFATKGYAKLKEEGGRGLLVKFLYWFFPSEFNFGIGKKIPSHIQEYIG